jgi:tRNA nucleotidyltransferase (CCA-adding enzyme)
LDNLEDHPQFLLRMADRMGNKLKAHLPITDKQRDFQDRIIKVYHDSSAHSLRELAVDGEEIKRELGLEPGPKVGKIIRFLFEAVEENPRLNNSKELLEIARTFLEEEIGNSKVEQCSAESSESTSS